jgi:hypothetical protein
VIAHLKQHWLRFAAPANPVLDNVPSGDQKHPARKTNKEAGRTSEPALWGVPGSNQDRGLALIRFGGHLLKGNYDVHNGSNEKPAAPPAV